MKLEIFTGILHDEPAEAYHAKANYISSSPLPEMGKSPAHFYHAWKTEKDTTAAMEKGTFIHKIGLEQDIAKYVKRPVKDDGSLVRSNSKEYERFLAENPGKTPLNPELYDDAMAILSAFTNNQPFMRAFERCDKEVSFYGQHPGFGIPLKARPDAVAKDFSFMIDVKSTAKSMARFDNEIFAAGYDVRAMHYVKTIEAVTGKKIPEIYFLAIESNRPYGCKMFRLSTQAYEAAEAQWNLWIAQVATCLHDDKWPSYKDVIIDVVRPHWFDVETVDFEGVG